MAVYLLHLDTKLAHTQHYIGYASEGNVKRRLEHHKNGTGARYTQVCVEKGIGFELVRVWKGKGKDFERHLKNQHRASTFCPICNPKSFKNNMKG